MPPSEKMRKRLQEVTITVINAHFQVLGIEFADRLYILMHSRIYFYWKCSVELGRCSSSVYSGERHTVDVG